MRGDADPAYAGLLLFSFYPDVHPEVLAALRLRRPADPETIARRKREQAEREARQAERDRQRREQEELRRRLGDTTPTQVWPAR